MESETHTESITGAMRGAYSAGLVGCTLSFDGCNVLLTERGGENVLSKTSVTFSTLTGS